MTHDGAVPNNIEGVPVEYHLTPTTIDELAKMVGDLSARGPAIFPLGGGTAMDFGWPPTRPGVLLDTTRLTRIDDYPSEDMTITVETGIRVAELSRVLADKGQELPIDVPDPDRATLGGLLATNTNGPRRYGRGTLRDYVLGIDVIDAWGRRIHAGGRVVKNVAGYDLMKMHTGALGTLGAIAQVTMRVQPMPEDRAVVGCPLESGQVEPALDLFTTSPVRPVAIELVNRAGASAMPSLDAVATGAWVLVVLFEESRKAVDWQVETVSKELRGLGIQTVATLARDHYAMLCHALTTWPRASDRGEFRASMPPSKVFEFCRLAEKESPGVGLVAHAGNGIVTGDFPTADLERSSGILDRFRDFAVRYEGNLIVPRCPWAWKRTIPVWGEPRGDWPIMRRLKEKLDPGDLFNPGRFVTGR